MRRIRNSSLKAAIAVVLAAALIFSATVVTVAGCSDPTTSLKSPSKTPGKVIPASAMLSQEDILTEELPFGPDMSPDGTRVMWEVGQYSGGAQLPGWKIYVTELATLASREVSSGSSVLSVFPRWSPDGATIAFGTLTADGTTQLFTVPATGGPPRQVTNVEGGVTSMAWQSPGTIAFVEPVPGAESKASTAAGDDTVHVTQTTDDKARIFQVDVATGAVGQVTDNDDQITAMWVSPDGSRALVTRTRATGGEDLYYGKIPVLNYMVDLKSGSERPVLKNVSKITGATWTADASTVYAQCASSDEVVYTTVVKAVTAQSGRAVDVNLGWSRGIHGQTNGTNPVRAVRGGFMALLADGANPKLALYSGSVGAPVRAVLKGANQGNVFDFDASTDGGTICYYYSTFSRPPQLYTATVAGGSIQNPRQVSNLNPGWSSKQFTHSETITWSGAAGQPVEGILTYPNGYEPNRRYPLMLMIHGGPDHMDLDTWLGNTYPVYPYQMIAQKGAFVLAPNYHGSTEYGLDFESSLKNHFYSYPLDDMESAVTMLSDKGMVDANRLATLGWSNGSILSQALIVKDHRFRAASCGAGGNEWVSLWAQSKFGNRLLEYYFGVDPVQDPGYYKDPANAPFYSAKSVRTPVVIYQGSVDDIVPPAMSWIAFRGLQKYGQAPVEYFIFPGEGHSPTQFAHLKRKLSADMKWFDKYFFKK
jgi:dipeptidyl aminopeptidase/acylaminoacyl peptidase